MVSPILEVFLVEGPWKEQRKLRELDKGKPGELDKE